MTRTQPLMSTAIASEDLATVTRAGRAASSTDAVDGLLSSASEAFRLYRTTSTHTRSRMLRECSQRLEAEAEKVANLLVKEIGKPISEARFEVGRAVAVMELTASYIEFAKGKQVPLGAVGAANDRLGLEIKRPSGVVVAIAPYNAPVNLLVSKVAAALGAGCTVVAKAPPQAPETMEILGRIIKSVWSAGEFELLHGGVEVGQRLVESPIPRVVTFTGSLMAGLDISRRAGLKKTILELGSNAPTIICEDADIVTASQKLRRGAFGSAGQACISTQRILVAQSRYDEFLRIFADDVASLRVGDPSDESTEVGPVVDDRAKRRYEQYIDDAINRGGKVAYQKEVNTGNNLLLGPTVLIDTEPEMLIRREEAFAPVCCVVPFSSDAHAIDIANETPYGLQAGVFTSSIRRALEFSEALEFGSVQINETSRVRQDIHPFGGLKNSGIGSEGVQNAVETMRDTVYLGLGAEPIVDERYTKL